MSPTPTQTTATQLDHLVAKISALVEAGQQVDLALLTTDCPQHREQLEMLLPTLQAVVDLEHRSAPDATQASVAPPGTVEGVLGDFRIIREIGRGGMGIVYEAEQISLGRRMALKVLPLAATLNETQLQRFKNEARAAASLNHPHIVGVHSVGAERGVHYYAMELVEGQSLAEVIKEVRASSCPPPPSAGEGLGEGAAAQQEVAETLPVAALSTLRTTNPKDYYRQAARLIADAADALDYAHNQGVIHRDIKPANLLVDDQAHVWITDFGLARLENDVGVTMTGDLLGTLRYMSPEQAAGRYVDHRTDIYSLGVTLYELVALRPAFASNDRQELLQLLLHTDPTPLRRLMPKLPADIETIVHKAIEKDATDRYQTAGQLADDLRRFLNDQTIHARPPTLWERGGRWVRRHQRLACAASVIFVLAFTGLTVATMLVAHQRSIAQRNAQAAEHNLHLAAEAVEQLLVRMAEQTKSSGRVAHAAEFLTDAEAFYDRLLAQGSDQQVAFRTARGLLAIGETKHLLGEYESAQSAYRRAAELYRGLSRSYPDEAVFRLGLATAYAGIGDAVWSLHRYLEAERPYRQSLEIRERLASDHAASAEYQKLVADSWSNLARVYWTIDQWDVAEADYRSALAAYKKLPATWQDRRDVVTSRAAATGNLGILMRERGDVAQAREYFDQAERLNRRALEFAPHDPALRQAVYNAMWNHTDLLLREGKTASVADHVEELVREFPDWLQAYLDGAELLVRSSELVGDPDRQPLIDRAGALLRGAQTASFRSPERVELLAGYLADCPEECLRNLDGALELVEPLVEEYSGRPEVWHTLGKIHYRRGEYQEALAALNKSVDIAGEANCWDCLLLTMTHVQLGNHEEAHRWWEKVKDVDPGSIVTINRPGFVRLRQEATVLVDNSN